MADRQHLQKPLQRSLLVTLCVGETYKLSTSPSQGQGWWVWQEKGSYSLDLRKCASPFFCQNGPLPFPDIALTPQIDPDLSSCAQNTCQVSVNISALHSVCHVETTRVLLPFFLTIKIVESPTKTSTFPSQPQPKRP